MQISICDVCWYKSKKSVSYRFVINFGATFQVHLCAEHQLYFKGLNREQFVLNLIESQSSKPLPALSLGVSESVSTVD